MADAHDTPTRETERNAPTPDALVLSADEREVIGNMRNPAIVLHDCRMMAALLVDLTDADRAVALPSAVTWLADRLALHLDRIEVAR